MKKVNMIQSKEINNPEQFNIQPGFKQDSQNIELITQKSEKQADGDASQTQYEFQPNQSEVQIKTLLLDNETEMQEENSQIKEGIKSTKQENVQQENDDKWKQFNFQMNTSLLGQIFLLDVFRLLLQSAKDSRLYKKLTLENLPQLFPWHRVEYTHEKLQAHIDEAVANAEKKGKQIEGKDFIWIFVKIFKFPILIIVLLNVFITLSKMYSTTQIKYLLQSIEKNGVTLEAYMCALKFNIAMIFYVVFCHNGPRVCCMVFAIFRNAFMKALYQKVASLSSHAVKQANVGKLINLVANDLTSIEFRLNIMLSVFTTPFPLILIGFIIYNNYGFMGIIGLICMALSGPLQMLLSHISTPYYEQKSKIIDERVKLTNEIIEGIRLIKMYAWEEAFKQSIRLLKSEEFRRNIKIQILTLINESIENTSNMFGAVVMFSLVYHFYDGQNLDIGTIFSSIDLLQFLKVEVVSAFGRGIQGIFQLRVILSRMVSVMTMKNSSMTCIQGNFLCLQVIIFNQKIINKGQNEFEQTDLEEGCIEFQNFNAYWKENAPVLQDINLSIKKGECISIVGKVGSGKTSLLNCILKEIPFFTGNFNFNGKLAYVEQEPYIFNCSIKDNITFGKEFDNDLYKKVIKSCCLEQDIEQFDQGDETQIGERGINISGGQKARISLARAVYSQADIYLFDDPLSAVDAKVAKNIFFDVIKLLGKEQTVLLTTHQIHFTRYTDKILIFEDGRIKSQGTYNELEQDLQQLSLQLSHNQGDDEKSSDSIKEDEQTQSEANKDKDTQTTVTKQVLNKEKQQIKEVQERVQSQTKEEDIKKDQVSLQTYKFFYNLSSYPCLWYLILFFYISNELVFITYNKTLGRIKTEDVQSLLTQLWWILGAYFVNQIIKNIIVVLYFNNSAFNLHEKMIHSLIRSTVKFFDITTSGKILNLFSTDIGIIDGSLYMMVSDVLEIIIQVFILLGSVVLITPYYLLIAVIKFLILRYFVNKTKQALFHTKQLDLNQKAPVFTFFNVVVQGVLPIRVYRQQQFFEKQFNVLGNNSLRATWYFCLSSRGFGSYIHLFATFANALGIFLIISVLNSGSQIGQAIVFFMCSSEYLQWGVRQLIQTDVAMSSTQRCRNLVLEQPEADLITNYDKERFGETPQIKQKNQNYERFNDIEQERFPSNGKVIFKNVKMRYRQDLSLVLRNLSFKIQSGMRVGFVGRTGAGKSSIIQALFRMTEIETDTNMNEKETYRLDIEANTQESGIFIDGHNLKELGLHTLRGGISIIPQVPFVFSGTIRRNLDPLNQYNDKQIEDVLTDIGLLDKVNSLDKKLYTDMSNTQQIFSTGQKQLICLGRAILRQSKLILLDEATANCDMLTDELIQQKIRERFQNSTIITIAHRLNTIADYDQIIVIDQGQAVEQGTPYELLQNQNGYFYQMVSKTGSNNANIILKIAEEKNKEKQ